MIPGLGSATAEEVVHCWCDPARDPCIASWAALGTPSYYPVTEITVASSGPGWPFAS